MKEIKFRVWDFSNNIYLDNNDYSVLLNNGKVYISYDDGVRQRVSRDGLSFEQYTGLKDKNGVEIYENDILDFDEREWGGNSPYDVITIDKLIDDFGGISGSLSDIKHYRKIVGNIHENKELVK